MPYEKKIRTIFKTEKSYEVDDYLFIKWARQLLTNYLLSDKKDKYHTTPK